MNIANRFLLAIAFYCFSCTGFALAPTSTLKNTVANSDWIFVGHIEKIHATPSLHDVNGDLSKIEISVKVVLCGKPEALGLAQGRLELLYRPQFIERPRFEVGNDFLFFWKNDENGPRIAPEYYGALPVNGDSVDMSAFFGAAKRELVEDVRKKISCPRT